MFEELDDPTPDLRPGQTLPLVRARGRTLRRRRQLATATGAGGVLALVAGLILTLPSGVTTETLTPATPAPTTTTPPVLVPSPQQTHPPTASPTPGTTPPPTSALTLPPAADPTGRVGRPVAPSPSGAAASSSFPGPSGRATPPSAAEPTPGPSQEQALELRGDDLAVTAAGAPRAEAVAALTTVLGAPLADPAKEVGCVLAQTEVAWSQFRAGFDSSGRLSGWASTSPDITTPSGVTVGTTVVRLQQVYGDRLRLSPSDSEAGDTYTVEGVQMLGTLSGTDPSDRVVALRNGACTGP